MWTGRNAALTIAAIGAAIALAGCTDKTHGSEQTLKFIQPRGHTRNFGIIGTPSQRGLSPGTGFAFSAPLQNSAGKVVGGVNAFCIATQPSPSAVKGTCSGTAAVPGGTLALSVGGSLGNNVSGAIVGGTGKYAGATGTFSSVHTGGKNGPRDDTAHITLP
jgi:hypothetical protein